jgi:hypothetical protein
MNEAQMMYTIDDETPMGTWIKDSIGCS